jgi:pimeloyl-ACP methyl ester carboxylesterase
MTETIQPFELRIPEDVLEDLRSRLARTRWPDSETVPGWQQGVPLQHVRDLCDYWLRGYDWRRCEARLNALGQFRTVIDGLGIHFLHVRSRHPGARPLILTHGWPGSVVEFLDVIAPLTDPEAHGGRSSDAFHVVIPSLPGFGFSDKPSAAGWKLQQIATAWITLMRRLGYERFLAQGGDWGSFVTTTIGAMHPPECMGIHLNTALVFPEPDDLAALSPAEEAALADGKANEETDSAYMKLQATRPQTLGYALTDSPAGQAAWIYEKLNNWSDNDGTAEGTLSRDAMLDNIMLYWLPGAAASSARIYWDNAGALLGLAGEELRLPVGVSIFPKEVIRPSRRWAERRFRNIIYWNEVERGGHFAAFEQPAIFVRELRACFQGF